MILLSFAVVINLVTFWLFPTMPVYFGILHLLAVAPWLSWWWLKIADVKWLLIAAGLVICGGIWLNSLSSGNWLTLAFGWPPARLAMLDYYPLFPWLGVYWLGMVGARVWFRRGESSQSQPVSVSAHFSWLSWAGRNSLLIYILHQPIIVLILTILNRQAS